MAKPHTIRCRAIMQRAAARADKPYGEPIGPSKAERSAEIERLCQGVEVVRVSTKVEPDRYVRQGVRRWNGRQVERTALQRTWDAWN